MGGSCFDFQDEINAQRKPGALARNDSGKLPDDVLTVAQLTAQIEQVLKTHLPATVLVRGEVSNLKLHSASGHIYFTLKDPEACLNCVMFRSDAVRLKFTPEDGMELLATGRIGVYAQRGSYQLYATRLDPLGQGALELAFRQLCEKLEKEGLFAPERKKHIPAYPLRLALVTSRETAALQDMLKVLRRYPWVQLMLYHVPVQGEGAAQLIAQALREINRQAAQLGQVDSILLARGGGSLEDLWPFNEEVVARAIVASRIPVITGIGHEVDISVADLVADHHAHTPTEAAQVAVRKWRTADEDLDALTLRLRTAMRSSVHQATSNLAGITRHEFFRRPEELVEKSRQRLDDLQLALQNQMRQRLSQAAITLGELSMRLVQKSPRHLAIEQQRLLGERYERLRQALSRLLRDQEGRLSRQTLRLQRHHPEQGLRLNRQSLGALQQRLMLGINHVVASQQRQVDAQDRQLRAIGPLQVLSRGYSITTVKKTGEVVRSKNQVKGGQRLRTRLAHGEIESVAEDPNQPTLFT